MAKKHDSGHVKAALLADCSAGKAGEVVELTADEAAALVADGAADTSEAAVEHRESENKAKKG